MKTRSKLAGFTLIELLVVITIIALLVALLFPVINLGIAKGEISTCLNNLKQLHAAASQYSLDHDGQMVMPYTGIKGTPKGGTSTGENFADALPAYLGIANPSKTNRNTMHCPVQFKDMIKRRGNNGTTYTYTENHMLTSEVFGISCYNDGGGPNERTNMSPLTVSMVYGQGHASPPSRRVASPSTVPYFLDGWHIGANYSTWRIWRHVKYYYDNIGEEGLTASFPHDWKCNVVYLDGHAETTVFQEGLWEGTFPSTVDTKQMLWQREQGPLGPPGERGKTATISAF